MNIFILSKKPKLAAQMHCDKHVVKMILESAQMLSTVYRLTEGKLMKVAVSQEDGTYRIKDWYAVGSDIIKRNKPLNIKGVIVPELISYSVYAPTHINHPCTRWVMKSLSNYNWLVKLAFHLNKEFKYRFEHSENHKSWNVIEDYLTEVSLMDIGLTRPALAMDDEYKVSSGFSSLQTKHIVQKKNSIILVIASYRNYYAKAKANLLTYTKRNKPDWLGKI